MQATIRSARRRVHAHHVELSVAVEVLVRQHLPDGEALPGGGRGEMEHHPREESEGVKLLGVQTACAGGAPVSPISNFAGSWVDTGTSCDAIRSAALFGVNQASSIRIEPAGAVACTVPDARASL